MLKSNGFFFCLSSVIFFSLDFAVFIRMAASYRVHACVCVCVCELRSWIVCFPPDFVVS